jgi:hypothetical protein
MNRRLSWSYEHPAKIARDLARDLAEAAREMELVAKAERLGQLLIAQTPSGNECAGLIDQPMQPVTARGLAGPAREFLSEVS